MLTEEKRDVNCGMALEAGVGKGKSPSIRQAGMSEVLHGLRTYRTGGPSIRGDSYLSNYLGHIELFCALHKDIPKFMLIGIRSALR